MKIVVTGSTGLLGSHLIPYLLQNKENQLYLLIRSNEQIDHTNNENKGRIHFLKGDITKKKLGLTNNQIALLKETKVIIHAAAKTSLSTDPKDTKQIHETNYNGTQNVIDLSKKMPDLNKFIYISTAYVGGNSNSPLEEKEIIKKPSFRNSYEESKYKSETNIVQSCKESNINYTIIRPSLFLGDLDRDSERISRQTVYCYAQMLKKFLEKLTEHPKVTVPGAKNAKLNFIKVDHLAKAIELLIHNSDYNNQIINFVNSNTPTYERTINIIREGLQYHGKFLFHEENDQKGIEIKDKIFAKYTENNSPTWITDNAAKLKELCRITDISEAEMLDHIKKYSQRIANKESPKVIA